jgi:hypothetical protein
MNTSPNEKTGGIPDRDTAMHTRADQLGLVITALAIPFGGLSGEWLLLPAGYWVLILSLRLAAPGGRKRAGTASR